MFFKEPEGLGRLFPVAVDPLPEPDVKLWSGLFPVMEVDEILVDLTLEEEDTEEWRGGICDIAAPRS